MKNLFLTFTFIVFSCASFADCTIESFDKVLYIPGSIAGAQNQVIKRSDCSNSLKKKFTKRLFNSSGTVSSKILEESLGIKGVIVAPSKIQVLNLKRELKKRLNPREGWVFEDIKLLNKKKAIGLDNEDSFELGCEICHTTGEKNISITIHNPIRATSKTIWIQTTAKVTTQALVPKRAISPAEPQLSASLFELKSVNVIRPEKYFTNADQLVFYKVNKPLTPAKGLMFTDLSPINLVSSGIPAKVILRNKGLSLVGQGIPSQSGKLGEIIRLKNPKTNKTIIGKVIDFNKVLVDL